ncbi:MAG: transposase [Nitrospirota bacterium]
MEITGGKRENFLGVLGDVLKRYNWLCHAYCLMDNHYHLLIETPNANLSIGMRQLKGGYKQKVTGGESFKDRYCLGKTVS